VYSCTTRGTRIENSRGRCNALRNACRFWCRRRADCSVPRYLVRRMPVKRTNRLKPTRCSAELSAELSELSRFASISATNVRVAFNDAKSCIMLSFSSSLMTIGSFALEIRARAVPSFIIFSRMRRRTRARASPRSATRSLDTPRSKIHLRPE
jgi:hypothetical protein